jgi:hypothetical protein
MTVDNLGMDGGGSVNKYAVILRGDARFPILGRGVRISFCLSPDYPDERRTAESEPATVRQVIPVIPSAYYDD